MHSKQAVLPSRTADGDAQKQATRPESLSQALMTAETRTLSHHLLLRKWEQHVQTVWRTSTAKEHRGAQTLQPLAKGCCGHRPKPSRCNSGCFSLHVGKTALKTPRVNQALCSTTSHSTRVRSPKREKQNEQGTI